MWNSGLDVLIDIIVVLFIAIFGFYYIRTCSRVAARVAEKLKMNEMLCVFLSLSFTPWIMEIVLSKVIGDKNN